VGTALNLDLSTYQGQGVALGFRFFGLSSTISITCNANCNVSTNTVQILGSSRNPSDYLPNGLQVTGALSVILNQFTVQYVQQPLRISNVIDFYLSEASFISDCISNMSTAMMDFHGIENVVIESSTFSSNTAQSDFMNIYDCGVVNISLSLFQAIAATSILSSTSNNIVNVGNVMFLDNMGSFEIIEVLDSHAYFYNILNQNNTAELMNMYVDENSFVILEDVQFINNSVSGDGGALNIQGGSTVGAQDCVFSGNTAAERGGAFIVENSELVLNGGGITLCVAETAGAGMCISSTFVDNGCSIGGNISLDHSLPLQCKIIGKVMA